MKNFFKSVGKAFLYFAVYYGTTMAVSMVVSIVLSTKLSMEMMATGQELDTLALTELLTEQVMDMAMTMTFVSGVIALLIYWIVFLIRKKKFVKEVGVSAISAKSILPIILLGICFNIFISVFMSVIPFPQSWIDSYTANRSVIDNSLMAWIATVIGAPIVEEVVFRGLMYSRLKKGMPAVVAAVIASIAFGAVHGTIIWAIYTFVFGMLCIWLYERHQSLTANILFHMAFNLAGMVLSIMAIESEVVSWILFAVSAVIGAIALVCVANVAKEISEREEDVVAEE